MTYSTDSERRLGDRDDDRDEAYHASDETDTELDAAARPDATDTVDDETAHSETDEADDELTRDGDPFGVDEATREREAFQAGEADYEAAHADEHSAEHSTEHAAEPNRIDGEYADNQPTAVAVAPVNAVDGPAVDDVDAREAGTDRDAVEAVNAESSTGTVYQSEADDHPADNGPIVTETATEAPAVQEEMKPGSVEPVPVAAFWNDADAQGIRDRWRELQLRFIDDPESVANEAERLVEEAVASLTAALSQAKQDLGNWRDGQGSDTERLRAAVRNYRDFLDRVLGR